MQRIAVILNPISGSSSRRKTKRTLMNALRHGAQRRLYTVTSYRTRKAKHATELAAKAVTEGNDLVICCGGDGTVNETASALLDTNVPLAIVPTGSGNGLARHLGIPLSAAPALDIALHGITIPMDCGTINGRNFFTTAGIGLDAEVGWLFDKLENRGMTNYVRATAQLFFQYKPNWYSINVDGKAMRVEALMITFANASQFGNNAIIAPNANVSDGFLDLVIMRPFPKVETVRLATMLFNKTIDRSPYITTIRFKKLHLEVDEPMHGHIDGEPFMLPKSFDVAVRPSCLAMRAPQHRSSIPLLPPPAIFDPAYIVNAARTLSKNMQQQLRSFKKREQELRKNIARLRDRLQGK